MSSIAKSLRRIKTRPYGGTPEFWAELAVENHDLGGNLHEQPTRIIGLADNIGVLAQDIRHVLSKLREIATAVGNDNLADSLDAISGATILILEEVEDMQVWSDEARDAFITMMSQRP